MKFSFNIVIILKKIFIKTFFIILALIVVAVAGVGYKYFIAPLQKDINEGGSVSLVAKDAQLKELTLYLGKMKNMSEQYQSYSESKIKTLMSILPREKDIPGLFVQMQEIAKKNNFLLGSIAFSDTGSSSDENAQGTGENANTENAENAHAKNSAQSVSGIKEMNVSFIISGGNYDNMKSFLSDIEKNLRLFDIYDINFGSTKEGPYSMNLRTYYLSQ